jgi:predicted Zn-dependent peptidase
VEEVAQRFASFDATPAPKPLPAMFGKGGSRVVHRDLEQAHLTLALEGVPQTDLSLFSLQVFTNTLGGGMSSRLFQEVREKRGLCYSIYTFHAPYSDTGFFGLYTGTDPGDAPEMMEVIVDVINDAVETLTEAEIARAKAQMKAGLLMAWKLLLRAEQLAPRAGLWPAADGGRTGGADRRGQRRIDPQRRPRCVPQPAGGGRLAAAGVWTRRCLLRKD